MLKRNELTHTNSCFNRAKDDEMIFVLLSRDPAASVAIRAWVAERIKIGKNKLSDLEILEALQCAQTMEAAQLQRRVDFPVGGNKAKFDDYPTPLPTDDI